MTKKTFVIISGTACLVTDICCLFLGFSPLWFIALAIILFVLYFKCRKTEEIKVETNDLSIIFDVIEQKPKEQPNLDLQKWFKK